MGRAFTLGLALDENGQIREWGRSRSGELKRIAPSLLILIMLPSRYRFRRQVEGRAPTRLRNWLEK